MKVLVGIQLEYPVVTLEKAADKPHQPPAEDAPALDLELQTNRQVDMSDPIFDRYQAARTEWVAIQQLLYEEYGDQFVSIRPAWMDPRRLGRTTRAPEWIPEGHRRQWGLPS